MARVTAAEVKVIMDNCTVADATVTAMIAAASQIIDNVFGSTDVTDATTQLELWLSAHIVASTVHRMAGSEKLGDAAVTYIGMFGEGLKSTPYGQMVLTLDSSGELVGMEDQVITFKAIESFD